MIRLLTESKKYIVTFANPDTNCFILEFHNIILFEAFRRWLLKAAVAKIYETYKIFKDILESGESLGSKIGFNSDCPVSSKAPFSALLDKSHKRFIKRKVNLDPKVIMSEQVLLEFFQGGYPLSYNSNSQFCRKYYMCGSPDKDSKQQSKAIIVIDVVYFHIVLWQYNMPEIRS